MAKKGGLGRGLEALIPGGEVTPLQTGGSMLVPIDKVLPNPRQPRDPISDDDLTELSNSIREHGILQPLLVSSEGSGEQYTLIAGERRLRSAKMAGLEMVPVVVRSATSEETLELALVENVQRSDLSPLETAEAYRQLVEDFKLSHEEIATRVAKSRVSVTNTLRLLKLPESVRRALAEGRITEGHARVLLALGSVQAQNAALQTILRHDLSVRQTESLIHKMGGEKKPIPTKRTNSPEVKAMEERLRGRLGTKVSLTHGKSGGTLTIRYYSQEELDSILKIILGE